MIRRIALALALTVALTASGSSAGFRSVLQVSVGGAPAAYSGPGDIVSGAHMFWGLRGYNAAFSGAVASVCDAATGLVCADATWAAGVLSLPLIGGIACNNVTNICQIATLYDQIGGNNCTAASCNLVTGTGALTTRPGLVVPGAANGCPTTAFPCLSFVRASNQCLRTANSYSQAQSFTFLGTTVRTGTFTAIQQWLSNASSVRTTGWSNAANTLRQTFGTVVTATASDSVWHSLQYVANGASGAFGIDGTSSTADAGASNLSTAMVLGSSNIVCTNSTDMLAVEAGVWPAAFTAQNITDMSANVRGYWGF